MSTKRIKIFNYLIPGIVFSLGIVFIISSLFFAGNDPAEDFPQGYHIISPDVPGYLVFAGESSSSIFSNVPGSDILPS